MNLCRPTLALAGAALVVVGFTPSAQASFPGANGRIAYTQSDVDFTYEDVLIMGPDGSHQTRLIAGVTPAYSPDGRQIAFTSSVSMPRGSNGNELDYSELYVMNANGSHVRRITFNFGFYDWQPAWSPDGKRLVWMRGPSSSALPGSTVQDDLWIVDLETGIERNLTHTPNIWEAGPQWSPDGQRIAFDGDVSEPGNNDVYTIMQNGRDLKRLTSGPGYDESPNYSPNGEQIAFDSDRTGKLEVFVMGANGSRSHQLTNSREPEYGPIYSPDGRFIAFGVGEVGEIYRMRSDGSQPTNLTKTPLLNEFGPDWQPR